MTTSKKTTSEKTAGGAGKKTKPPKGSNNFPQAYIRLRTVLDAVEIGALQYCLREESTTERIRRAEEIEKLLVHVLDKIKDKPTKPTASCAEGYYNCGGVCVPYQCPSDK
ncbi:MAG TPA: hypothetical protein VK400_17625 [Pyrinomonadaceae bacterium]|nr:hypothetical protein [Pyrinomonadaceae bacterium]